MRILCRCDDFGWSTEASDTPPIKLPDTGLALAQRFHEAMGGSPYLAGVIAKCVDDEGRAWLQSKPAGLTVALHGWDHGAWQPRERDEFSALSETQSRERIELCQRKVGPTPYWIPPYNSLAPVFLATAWHEGVRYVFSGPSGWPTPPSPYQVERLWIVPAWAPLYGGSRFRQGESPSILESLSKVDLDKPGHAVITLHIGWEADKHEYFDGVRELVDRVREHLVTPDEYIGGIR